MSSIATLTAVGLVSAAGTWAARRYALHRRLVDEPGERRSHVVATPRGGGLGPVLGILVAMLAPPVAESLAAGLALALVAFVGGWDDHRPLSARTRLAVHVLAALVLAWGIAPPAAHPFAFALTVACATVLVNVWNFMDGIDGLAASQAALVALAAALLVPSAAGWGFGVAMACAAFLPFNAPKARIFLGDIGSGALGLALAALASRAIVQAPMAAVALLLPAAAFLVDASLTLARRMLRRERWWEAHAQHLYQALARRYGHPRVTLGYAIWTFVGLGLALAVSTRPGLTVPVVCLWYTTATALWLFMQRRLATGRDKV